MKVRFAVAPGGIGFDAATYIELVNLLEALGFDTIWLSDLPLGATVDPIVGLGYAAATTRKLKLGANVVPFGRNPMVVAKSLAQLDQLSAGRVLISLVPGIDQPGERAALGIGGANRGKLIEETIPVLRAWWRGDAVTYEGQGFSYDAVRVDPQPVQDPLEIWLGGNGPQALDRIGRLADGWLGAAVTPSEAGEAVRRIQRSASEVGRVVPDDHFGMSLGYGHREPNAQIYAALRKRRPDVDPRELIPVGRDGLRDSVKRFIDHGVTKFVVRPNALDGGWKDELDWIADAVLDLQT